MSMSHIPLGTLEYLLSKCGMKLVDVEMNQVNGSSYRFYIRKNAGPEPTSEAFKRIARIRFDEFNMALDTETPYREFKENIERNKNDLLFFINQEKAKGKKVFVYGASTRVMYCSVLRFRSISTFAAERNPRKWGARTLGSNIPIVSEEDARAMSQITSSALSLPG